MEGLRCCRFPSRPIRRPFVRARRLTTLFCSQGIRWGYGKHGEISVVVLGLVDRGPVEGEYRFRRGVVRGKSREPQAIISPRSSPGDEASAENAIHTKGPTVISMGAAPPFAGQPKCGIERPGISRTLAPGVYKRSSTSRPRICWTHEHPRSLLTEPPAANHPRCSMA